MRVLIGSESSRAITEIITRVPKARVMIISDITRLMSLLIVASGYYHHGRFKVADSP